MLCQTTGQKVTRAVFNRSLKCHSVLIILLKIDYNINIFRKVNDPTISDEIWHFIYFQLGDPYPPNLDSYVKCKFCIEDLTTEFSKLLQKYFVESYAKLLMLYFSMYQDSFRNLLKCFCVRRKIFSLLISVIVETVGKGLSREQNLKTKNLTVSYIFTLSVIITSKIVVL